MFHFHSDFLKPICSFNPWSVWWSISGRLPPAQYVLTCLSSILYHPIHVSSGISYYMVGQWLAIAGHSRFTAVAKETWHMSI